MPDTVQKYKDFVITSFLKSVQPIVFEKASGAVVTDVNGREYLDCFAGISVVNAGHNHPQVIAAAKAQMDKLVHCASYIYHCQPTADLAEKMAQLAPRGLTKTFFGNGARKPSKARLSWPAFTPASRSSSHCKPAFMAEVGARSALPAMLDARNAAGPTPRAWRLCRHPMSIVQPGPKIPMNVCASAFAPSRM